jgi:DNA-binding NarL/FixJ family response regulator
VSPSAQPAPLTVAVVEDNAPVRASLVEILQQSGECQCVGQYASGEAAVAGLPMKPARVVIMDINLLGMTGVECVRRLAGLLPDTVFIMLTVHKDADNLFNALAAGASGYLLKPIRAPQLLAAVKDVDQGGSPMTSSIARQVVATFHRRPASPTGEPLSEREEQVLKLLAAGFLYKQVAAELNLSINTLCEYIRRIYRKLHVHSRQDAVAHYQQRR